MHVDALAIKMFRDVDAVRSTPATSDEITKFFSDWLAFKMRLQSPIEELLGAPLFAIAERAPDIVTNWQVALEPQAKVLGFRADFLVTYNRVGHDESSLISAVVECDGHEFHEKTKAQAQHDKKRDRKLTQAGYLILRFTGSEIFRNPEGCANEIFECVIETWQKRAG